MKKYKLLFTSIFLLCSTFSFAANTVKLGHISFDGSTAYFPNASVSGDELVYAISVNVDKGYIVTGSITAGTLYADKLTEHQTAVWSFTDGISTESAQGYVQALKLNYVEGMSLTLDVNSNKTDIPSGATVSQFIPAISKDSSDNDIAESGGTAHYYMYVGNVIKWGEAFDKAKSYTFLGMKGYLATITSKDEDSVLDNITDNPGWAGGARIQNTSLSNLDGAYSSLTVDGSADATTWSWCCGPEAGFGIPVPSRSESVATKAPIKGTKTTYNNWNDVASESCSEPNGTSSTGEAFMQVHYGTTTKWNDLSNSNYTENVKGYFVEFSSYGSSLNNYNYATGYGSSKSAVVTAVTNQVYDETNGQDYSSIAEAVEKADSGDRILLSNNQTVSNQGTSGKKLTIDANGKVLTGTFAVSDGALKITGNTDTVNLTSVTVSGGSFTLNGGKITILNDSSGTLIVDGLVMIDTLNLALDQKILIGTNLDSGSSITLQASPDTGIITSGFGANSLGTVINLPANQTDYMLIKTKSGELKVIKHK